MFYHNKAPANHLTGASMMVGHTGILWNRISPWLLQVERLREQVGLRGAKALIGGEFGRL